MPKYSLSSPSWNSVKECCFGLLGLNKIKALSTIMYCQQKILCDCYLTENWDLLNIYQFTRCWLTFFIYSLDFLILWNFQKLSIAIMSLHIMRLLGLDYWKLLALNTHHALSWLKLCACLSIIGVITLLIMLKCIVKPVWESL